MKTIKLLRLLDLYKISTVTFSEKTKDLFIEIINEKQENNIKNMIKLVTEYYKNRQSNKEEYILAYN